MVIHQRMKYEKDRTETEGARAWTSQKFTHIHTQTDTVKGKRHQKTAALKKHRGTSWGANLSKSTMDPWDRRWSMPLHAGQHTGCRTQQGTALKLKQSQQSIQNLKSLKRPSRERSPTSMDLSPMPSSLHETPWCSDNSKFPFLQAICARTSLQFEVKAINLVADIKPAPEECWSIQRTSLHYWPTRLKMAFEPRRRPCRSFLWPDPRLRQGIRWRKVSSVQAPTEASRRTKSKSHWPTRVSRALSLYLPTRCVQPTNLRWATVTQAPYDQDTMGRLNTGKKTYFCWKYAW